MPTTQKYNSTIEVFLSYSHKDEPLLNELEKHLGILKRQNVIAVWHDRKIGAGKEWKGEIDTHLNTAHLILLLVSADFIASDYCYDLEVKRAMERHKVGEARVIPIILRAVDWKEAPFGKLQALPTDGQPVTSCKNHDEAFRNILRGIRNVIEELIPIEGDSDKDNSKTITASGKQNTSKALQEIEKQEKNISQQIQSYGKSHKIIAWQQQIQILEKRVTNLIKAMEAVDRLWTPERYREIELKIEHYSEEIDSLTDKIRLLKD